MGQVLHKNLKFEDMMIELHQRPGSATAGLRREILLVFVFILSVFFLTSAGFDTSEGSYDYRIAHQVLTEGALSFATYSEGSYQGAGITTIAPNGRTYASHEFGNALFLLPVAGLNILLERTLTSSFDSRRIGFFTGFTTSLMPVIYCSFTVALFYAMLRISFEKSISSALGATIAFAFCTFVWTYSRNLFDGVLCMCILTGAVLFMLQFKRTMNLSFFMIAIALCGLGIITRLTMVLLLAALTVYLVMVFWREPRRLVRLAILAATVLIPFAVWQGYYNHLRTGHWLISPVQSDQYASTNGLTGNLAVGAFGLLFSPGKSIFVYVPLAVLSVVCFRRFFEEYRCEAIFSALLSALWLAVHGKLATNWYGSWGWGPRHFITIAPVLVLPACVCWEWMGENLARRVLLSCALAWGAILSVSSIIGNWHLRMQLASIQGRYDAMTWSPSGGQAMDMIRGALSNIRNIVLRLPVPMVPGYSPINCYASNTINIWINAAAYAGVSRLLLSFIALLLGSVAAYCAFALRGMSRRSSAAKTLPL
jgi:4-amino-4-deoxy-L-arabinose transferase-like glycosyltransferase